MDLRQALPGMSWRRFQSLLSGLPPSSALLQALIWRKEEPEISSPQEVLTYLTKIGW